MTKDEIGEGSKRNTLSFSTQSEMTKDGTGEGSKGNTVTVGTQTNQSFASSEVTKDGTGEGSNRKMVTVGTQTSQSFASSAELLLGIPNQITLDEIIPRLKWRDFHALSSVSSSWLEAIRSRQVYNARVGANSTETLVVHTHRGDKTDTIALYSTSDKRCFQLPPIPHLDNRIPSSCGCVSLDGKVYVLGGADPGPYDAGTIEVFVFDIAGQRQWKQCASMEEHRQDFGCGVLDGKIYVFGGSDGVGPACGSEVYDPKVNEWSPILPMPSWRFNHQVAAIGEEFFVYGGEFYEPNFFEWLENGPHIDPDDDLEYGDNGANGPQINPHDLVEYNADGSHTGLLSGHMHAALFLEVYHPVKNEWRIVEPFGRNQYQNFFVTKGKFYEMGKPGIMVYDMETKSWTHRHANSYAFSVLVDPNDTLAVNDELFTRVYLQSSGRPGGGPLLLQSQGFDSEKNEMVWRKTKCKCGSDFDFTMCTILL